MSTLPVISIKANQPNGAYEGNSGSTPFTFTVTRTGDLSGTSSVSWTTFNNFGVVPSTDAQDFVGGVMPQGGVFFEAGQSTATITVNIAGDTVFEQTEELNILLTRATGATISSIDGSAHTLVRNDDQPTMMSLLDGSTMYEGNSGSTAFTFTVTRDYDVSRASSVLWRVFPLSTNFQDFVGGVPSGQVSFAVGQKTATITVNVAGDAVVEPNEAFDVILYNPVWEGPGYPTVGQSVAHATILNDDPSTLSISADQISRNEGNAGTTAFTFMVTRVGDLTGTAQASYTVGGTASARQFVGSTLPSGIVTFAAGASTATITVNVAGDTVFEPDESFTVTLSSPVNTVLRQATASAIILNDDPAATLADDTANPADGITSDPALTGTAEAGSTITVSNGDTVLGTVVADAAGAWSFLPTLADGSYSLTVTQFDLAGRTSSGAVSLTLDTTPPVLTAALASDTGTAGDSVTKNPALTGTAEANRTVTLRNGATLLGTTTADATGAWSFLPSLADGSYTLTASQTDLAGNTGSTTISLTLDTTPPKTVITDGMQTGNKPHTISNISGTTEAGSTVTLYDTGGTAVIAVITADSVTGQWQFVSSNLSDVAHDFTATAVDRAGNAGPVSNHALFGTSKNDVLTATGGDTLLIGNGQKDVMYGGGGVDTFVFHPSFGRDTIRQFDPSHDVLAFARAIFPSTVTSDASLASYVLSHTVQDAGGSVISFGGQSTITLTGVAKSSLVATDFHLIG